MRSKILALGITVMVSAPAFADAKYQLPRDAQPSDEILASTSLVKLSTENKHLSFVYLGANSEPVFAYTLADKLAVKNSKDIEFDLVAKLKAFGKKARLEFSNAKVLLKVLALALAVKVITVVL